jgi:hypothetical protein
MASLHCTICLELASSADDKTWSVLPCGHVYHTTCVAQHLEFKQSCPNCRVRTRLRARVTRLSPGVSCHNRACVP